MSQYIKLLTDMSFMAGIIGHPEYHERHEVADWLMDSENHLVDPRISSSEDEDDYSESNYHHESDNSDKGHGTSKTLSDEPEWLELLMMNQWMFTIGDVDCYPSVPHGHYKSKAREWPKLNPYTGRVFSDLHDEDRQKRLSKIEMKELWSDSKFVDHCREQVLWYSDFAPSYGFPRARRGKIFFPKWR
jgi:hypothetical protein